MAPFPESPALTWAAASPPTAAIPAIRPVDSVVDLQVARLARAAASVDAAVDRVVLPAHRVAQAHPVVPAAFPGALVAHLLALVVRRSVRAVHPARRQLVHLQARPPVPVPPVPFLLAHRVAQVPEDRPAQAM